MMEPQPKSQINQNEVANPNSAPKRERVSPLDVGYDRPKTIDISKYTTVPEYETPPGQPELPVKLMKDKDGNEIYLVLNRLPIPRPPEGTFPPELQKLITAVEDMEKQVMFDSALLSLIVKIGERYVQGLGVTIIGPSGISKSFGAWVMSVVAGLPYYDTTFGPSTEADEILGSPTLKEKRLNGTMDIILNDPELTEILNTPDHEKNKRLSHTVESIKSLYKEDSKFYLTPEGGFLMGKLFNTMDWPQPFIEGEIGWQDSDLVIAIMQGCFVVIDEKNRAPNQNPLTDLIDPTKTSLNIPGRSGRVYKSPTTFVVATQNVDSYQGTTETPHHIESRERAVVVGPSTVQFYVNLYNFFIRGQNPEFVSDGVKYRGKSDIETDFRGQLETLDPNVLDQLIVNLAKLHMLLISMAEEKKIGKQKRKEGGNYIFDQRDIRSILISVKNKLSGYSNTTDLETIVKAALHENYVDGLSLSDQPKVKQLIDDLPIWNMFRAKDNPDWARISGAPVKREQGGFRLGNMTYGESTETTPSIAKVSIDVDLIMDSKGNVSLMPQRSAHALELLFSLRDSGDIEIEELSDNPPRLRLSSNTHFGVLFINSWKGWPEGSTEIQEADSKPTALGLFSKVRQAFGN